MRRPDSQVRLNRELREVALSLGVRYDGLITTSQFHSAHLVGRDLSRELAIPWLAHLSDPWSKNPLNRLPRFDLMINGALERRTLAGARLISVPTREVGGLLQVDPEKIRVVPHCYVRDWYPTANVARGRNVIRHFGSMQMGRSLGPLIFALSRLKELSGKDPDITFEFYGGNPLPRESEELSSLAKVGLFETRISYQHSLELMCSSAGLLMVEGNYASSPFLPSKFSDYLGSGRPILGVSPDGPSAEALQQTGNFRLRTDREEEEYLAFNEFLNALESKSRTSEGSFAFECSTVTGRVDEILDELVAS